MNKHPKKLLVIFAEAALEKRLVQDAKKFGAHGYTIWDVRGGSDRGTHAGAWDNDRTIEMKTICSPEVADALAAHVLAEYAVDFGLTLYFADVQVLRSEKF
ncbi:MAG: P-II family nitrogen regulator [Brachymonas sp.]